ncbi:Choline/ethanolamine kinase domain-containing protein [Rozella allomycis CSF55]|uniref:Choline/ethanolamine kinase domain-containing protein n=1 Tax=Rozella allomycis (strain CSF55) TaxID=988480 RepID=A0A075AQ14_ROZAC|nr:Choline/ethanolamine kinase domain-containing protein [Rozella allomycis CSF55]|eukprot:EPZ32326.1 Choline/ethanolamine kinase domain-containing protein [Rozella allomycis CSF55]
MTIPLFYDSKEKLTDAIANADVYDVTEKDITTPIIMDPGIEHIPTIHEIQNIINHVPKYQSAGIISVERLDAALSNIVFVCHFSNSSPLLIRFYGSGTTHLISRSREVRLASKISAKGLMPRILAAFDFGRVEEYIQGVAPLTPSNMRKPGISKKIAKQLRILHCVEVKEKSTQIWSQLDKWYTLLLSNQNLEQNHIEIIDNKLKELKMKLENSYEDEQTCLIHGDLQYGNILCDEDENLMLIDFEYSLIAQREYDIANHFCEWMANYDSENPHILHQNLFPSLEERYNFYRAYFEEKENVQLEQFDLIVMSFVPLSHLFWCIWGFLLANKQKGMTFDYYSYALQRLKYLINNT